MKNIHIRSMVFIVLSIFGLQGCDGENKGVTKEKITEIQTETLKSTSIVPFLQFIGRTVAVNEVSIVPRVEGELVKIYVADGQRVNKGDILYEIDSRPYIAALESAQAKLDDARASLALSHSNKIRAETLAIKSLISQEELENRKTTYAKMRAAYNMAKANIDLASLNLGFTKIKSPLSGQISYSKFKVGDRITTTTKNTLTTIVQTSPILFDFDIDEKLYRQIRSSLEHADKSESDLDISLTLSNGEVYPQKGTIVAVDNKINAATGTIRVQASFPNDELKLAVGEFGKLSVKQKGLKTEGVLVPQSAIVQDQQGNYVFVINNQNKAAVRYIQMGQAYGADVAIIKGLAPGDKIALTGLSKLKNDTEIKEVR